MSAPTDRPTEDPLGLTIVTAPTDQPIGDPQDTAHTDNPTDDPISDPLGPLTSAPSLDPSARPDNPNKPRDSSDPMTSRITTPRWAALCRLSTTPTPLGQEENPKQIGPSLKKPHQSMSKPCNCVPCLTTVGSPSAAKGSKTSLVKMATSTSLTEFRQPLQVQSHL